MWKTTGEIAKVYGVSRTTILRWVRDDEFTFKRTMCRKYGKTLVIVNEAYTTQTQSWDGKRQTLSSEKTISDGTIAVDRDINGARGIFLRAITR